jgi:hypothetical protein
MTQEEMSGLLTDLGAGKWHVKDVLRNGPKTGIAGMEAQAVHLVVRRNP